jgi:hypothetical protein
MMGPGLTRVNASVLDDPYNLGVAKEEVKGLLGVAKEEVKGLLAQILNDWDAHKRLQYSKVVLRSVLAGLV